MDVVDEFPLQELSDVRMSGLVFERVANAREQRPVECRAAFHAENAKRADHLRRLEGVDAVATGAGQMDKAQLVSI